MPVLTFEQALQRPPQADAQQTPSTQSPLVHWAPALHAAPLACGGTQCPAGAQKLPVVQSAFDRQVALHDVGPQT
jgi:hypothetical protein